MINTFYIPLEKASPDVLDTFDTPIRQLYQLKQIGLPTSPSFILPAKTLQLLLHKDEDIQNELMKFYHQQLQADFISVHYRRTNQDSNTTIQNILGESNFIETLFELAQITHTQPLFIQKSEQPLFSGFAWTKNQKTQNKNQIEIWSYYGTVPEESNFGYNRTVIDHRTKMVVEEQSWPTSFYWERTSDGIKKSILKGKPPQLNKKILQTIGDITIKAKRHLFIDQKISWIVIGTNVYLTSTELLTPISDVSNRFKVICMGTPLMAGYVQGKVFFENNYHDNLAGSILVSETLTDKDTNKIKNASGIIVEKNIQAHHALSLIKQYSIPTIINAHFAKKNLQLNQEILLDSTHGKVYVETKQLPNNLQKSDSISYSCITSYPSQLTTNMLSTLGNLVVTSNNWHIASGIHPLQYTSQHQKTFLATLYEEVLTAEQLFPQKWFYFFNTLDSNMRRGLEYGNSYEEHENNAGFGIRGTAFLLKHTPLLDLELEGLRYVHKKLSSSITAPVINLLLPFINNFEDGLFLQTVINEKFRNIALNTWLHISSLESLITTLKNDHWRPAGIVIDLDYILSSWHGRDPQAQFINSHYSDSSVWPMLQNYLESNAIPMGVLCRQLPQNFLPHILKLNPKMIITNLSQLTAARF